MCEIEIGMDPWCQFSYITKSNRMKWKVKTPLALPCPCVLPPLYGHRVYLVLFGSAWLGLAWLGLVWFGLVWSGLVWLAPTIYTCNIVYKDQLTILVSAPQHTDLSGGQKGEKEGSTFEWGTARDIQTKKFFLFLYISLSLSLSYNEDMKTTQTI